MSDANLTRAVNWHEPSREECEQLGRTIYDACVKLIRGEYRGASVVVPIRLPDGLMTRVTVDAPYWFDFWTDLNGEPHSYKVHPTKLAGET